MTIGEVCTRTVIVAPRQTSVYEGAALMRQRHAGDIVVTDDLAGKRIPVGIVTDRDLVIEVLAQNLNPEGFTLGEIMSPAPTTGRERDGVFETIQLMRSEGVRRLPVVDQAGALVGIVTMDDLVELLAEELGALVGVMREGRRREIEGRK